MRTPFWIIYRADYLSGSNKQTEFKARLFEAFFTEQKDISNRMLLEKELTNIGVTIPNLSSVLDNKTTQIRIANKASHWITLGISSVPTLIFNSGTVVSGSRSVETYKQMLTELISSYQLTA